jgi:hypothetical protein
MAQFTLPNTQTGGSQTVNASSLSAAESQAQSSGTWSPSAGTYGANSSPSGDSSGGGGGSSGGGTGAATPNNGGDLSGLAAFGAQTSGVTQAQLAQQKAEFDAQLAFAQQQMQQLGIPQLQINQQLAQLQQQQFQAQLALAAQAQQVSQSQANAQLTGWLQPTPAVPSVQQWLSPGGTTAGATGGGLTQPAGTVVRNSQNQFGVVNSSGGLTPGDASNPAIYNAIKAGQGIVTIPDAQFAQFTASGGAGSGQPGAATGVGYPAGTVVRTSANNFGVVNANGSISPYGDATANAINGAVQSGSGIMTIPDALFQQGISMPATTPTDQGGAAGGAQQTLAGQLQQATLTGQYNGAPTEAASEFTRQLQQQQGQFQQTLGLQQGQLGQQYLATAASLQGPQNTFQLSNYMRGAQGNQAVPTYLQNLAGNVGTAAFQAPGTTAPTPNNAGNVAGQLMGQSSATPGWDYGQTTQALQGLMGSAQTLKPGSVEQLTPDELQALGSGLGAVGGDLPTFLAQYNASRVGQQAPVAQTALS